MNQKSELALGAQFFPFSAHRPARNKKPRSRGLLFFFAATLAFCLRVHTYHTGGQSLPFLFSTKPNNVKKKNASYIDNTFA